MLLRIDEGNPQNWITILLIDTQSNTSGIGTKVKLKTVE